MAGIIEFILNIISTVSVIILSRFFWVYLKSPLKSFPGTQSSKFSDLWRFLDTWRRHPEITQIDLHRKYGSAVRMGPNVVSLSDPDMIGKVFSTRAPWKKSLMTTPNDVMVGKIRVSNLFSTRDEDWHNMSIKPIRGLYNMTRALDVEVHVNKVLEEFLGILDERFARGVNAGKVVDMADYIPYFSWDSMSNMTFGKTYGMMEAGNDVADTISTSTRGLKYFAPVSQMPTLDLYLDKNPVKRIGPPPFTWATIQSFQAVAERQAETTESTISRDSDFLDKFLAAKKTSPDVVDNNMVVTYLLSNVLAGSDTTAIYACAALYYILKNPRVLEKVKQELNPRKVQLPVSWKATQEMPYFEAVMKEASRMHPGVGLMLERIVPEGGFTLPDGKFLPEGTIVGMNPWVISRNEKYFGKDTDEFIPERWLQQKGESQEAYTERRNTMKAGDLTFGAGSRICYGKNLAILTAYKLIATLFTKYEISLVDPEKEWDYRNCWFVYQYDVKVKLAPRFTS